MLRIGRSLAWLRPTLVVLVALALTLPLQLVDTASTQAATRAYAIFDTDDDTIQIPGQSVIGTASTMEAVMRFPAGLADQGVVFNEWRGGAEDKQLNIGADRVLGFYYPVTQRLVTGLTLGDGAWHHLAVVYDGAQQRLYIDGTRVDAVTRSGEVADSNLSISHIGAIFRDGGRNKAFNGHIDSFRHSNIARYSGAAAIVPTGDMTNDANTLLLYNFNDAPGSTTANDESAGNRDGTLGAGFAAAQSPTFAQETTGPTVSIDEVTDFEGTNEVPTTFAFRVTLSEASTETVTVGYETVDGTTDDADYSAESGTLIFEPGDTEEFVSIEVSADADDEPDETFSVMLTDVTNATITDAEGAGTILNDDDEVPPETTINIGDYMADEGDAETTIFSFPVTLTQPSEDAITVDWFTSIDPGDTADESDFIPATGSVVFEPGDTSEEVDILVNGDTDFEGDDTFSVIVTTDQLVPIDDERGVGTILNDDVDSTPEPTPFPGTFSIDDVSLAEGTGEVTSFTFTVTLSEAPTDAVTVDYMTAPGTASAEDDYTHATGTLTFLPEDTSETIDVLVLADGDFEPDETFSVILSDPDGATIVDDEGVGTILNDDESADQVDLAITKIDEPDPVTAGQALRYTISVSNGSATDATNVVMIDALPSEVTFVAAETDGGDCTLVDDSTVECQLGTLGAEETALVTIDVTAPATVPDGPITNEASVSADEPDPESENNSASADTTVVAAGGSGDTAAGFATGEEETTVQTPPGDGVQFSTLIVPEGVVGPVLMQEVVESVCSAPAATQCIGERLDLDAPDATAANPLELRFLIAQSAVPKNVKAKDITIFHTPDAGPQIEVPICSSKKGTVANPAPTCRRATSSTKVGGTSYYLILVFTAENGSWRPTAR